MTGIKFIFLKSSNLQIKDPAPTRQLPLRWMGVRTAISLQVLQTSLDITNFPFLCFLSMQSYFVYVSIYVCMYLYLSIWSHYFCPSYSSCCDLWEGVQGCCESGRGVTLTPPVWHPSTIPYQTSQSTHCSCRQFRKRKGKVCVCVRVLAYILTPALTATTPVRLWSKAWGF